MAKPKGKKSDPNSKKASSKEEPNGNEHVKNGGSNGHSNGATVQSNGKAKIVKNGPSNGNSNETNSTEDWDVTTNYQTQQHSTSSSLVVIVKVVVAICSLAVGIATPHAIDIYDAYLLSRPGATAKSSLKESVKTMIGDQIRKLLEEAPPNIDFNCDDEYVLEQYLHYDNLPGMHIVCFHPQNRTLTLYPESYLGSVQQIVVEDDKVQTHWKALKNVLQLNLGLPTTQENSLYLPWAVFSPIGERIATETDSSSKDISALWNHLGMAIVFQGGQWLWPGVKVGFTRNIVVRETKRQARNVTLETLSLEPLVLSVEGFLNEEECEHIQEAAEPLMQYSEVTLMDHDQGRPASDFRTSQTAFLPSSGDPTLTNIERKTASLVRIPRKHQEAVQVLRYGLNEKYDIHHDFFDPQYLKADPDSLKLIEYGRKNRLATVFWYLSTIEKGGATSFPRAYGNPFPGSTEQACSQGLQVQPELGKVIIFYSLTPSGERDDLSLHSACPVKEGIKWAANKWVWNAPMEYIRDD